MQKVLVERLQPGMILGREVHNERGDTLLVRGVALTSQYIERMRQYGYYAVFVRDGIADDVEPPDILSQKVRSLTFRHLQDVFAIAESAAAIQDENDRKEALASLPTASQPLFASLYRDVEKIVDEVTKAKTVSGLVSLKTHDNYTFEHSLDVAVVGVMLGQRLSLSSRDLHQLALGCLCHDIGKLVVPESILNKPARLSADEFAVVQRHPQAGYEIVQSLMDSSDIIARHVVRQHHERQDGKGYHLGMKGNNRLNIRKQSYGRGFILPAAEIAAVADVYSALASDRPYRQAMTSEEVAAILQGMAGAHLNREIVTRFLSILPAYPVGTEVVVISSKLQGYRGIVTNVDPGDPHRPAVLILFSPQGRTVAPFEVDTRKDRDIEIAASSYAHLVDLELSTAGMTAGAR